MQLQLIYNTNNNIKNLNQFKKAISEHKEYIILEHYVKPECTGEHRVPKKVQTNAYTTIVPDEPDNKVSQANGGLGYYNWYGKASQWEFNDDAIIQKDRLGYPIQKIVFV